MNWMIRLYPAAWQQRYGEEFAEALSHQRASMGLMVDVLGGAVDAWLHPRLYKEIKQGEMTMTNQMENEMNGANAMAMIRRCAVGGPRLSQRDQLVAGIWTAAGMLTLSTLYVVLRRLYHGTPAVEALGYTAMPGVYVLYLQMAYLRNRPLLTQASIVVGVLGTLYLALFAICAVA
jgi:hypothetical protein